jgi:hypothetical protein
MGFGQIVQMDIISQEARLQLQLSLCCDRSALNSPCWWGNFHCFIIIYNHFKQKYNSGQTLGIELGAMYWHFLDFLWFIYLYFYISLNKKKRKFGNF